jgi:hypothetical protein
VISADQFYEHDTGPMKQGDILLAGVARLVAEDRYTPPAWGRLDAYDITIAGARHDGGNLWLGAGSALVMVTSHDCHLDKEWNRRRRALIKAGMTEDEADREAEDDPALDRTFNASPLIRPEETGLDRGNLMEGRIVGYLPIPASDDGLVPEAVVDLTYRVTLDRLDIVRVAGVTDTVRTQLRYALARLETLRATSLGFEVEAVVGRHIEHVTIPNTNPLLVRLELEDGQTLELLQQPAEPEPGPARTRPPGR